ncbi:MAG: hypothetical protein V3T09_08735 [bacterium]
MQVQADSQPCTGYVMCVGTAKMCISLPLSKIRQVSGSLVRGECLWELTDKCDSYVRVSI